MQFKLRKRLRNSGIAGMLILTLCAGIFQSETGIVKAASDSQVVDGMTIEDGVVVDYEGTADHVVIPDGVTGIGYSAFSGSEKLKEITIPESVKRIEAYAFMNCESLRTITIPEGITTIELSAFENCGLSTVELPESVTKIETYAFRDCKKLEKIELPAGVKTIGEEAFSYCTLLKDIKLPDGVTKIEKAAFSGCHGLKEIKLPDSLTSIEEELFEDCINLATVQLPKNLKSIGDYAFNNCGLKKVELPAGVTSIGRDAFASCWELEEINIPKGVTSIGEETFFGDQSLSKVELPETLKSIGNDAFLGCRGLKEINIPKGVTNIGDSAFASCTGMSSVDIPDSVTKIGRFAIGYNVAYDANGDEFYLRRDNFIIVGSKGTTAEQYAKENGFKFVERMEPVVLTGENNKISAEDLLTLAEANKEQKITIINTQGISFVFQIGEMKPVKGVDFYDFDVSMVTDYTDLSNPEFEENEFVLGMRPVMSGKFPGNADLIIPVNEKWLGKTLYVYSLSEDRSCYYIGKECVVSEAVTITVENAGGRSLVFATKAVIKRGDANGDGRVNSEDALEILKYDVKLKQDVFIGAAADANKDGKINSEDALEVLKYDVKLVDTL